MIVLKLFSWFVSFSILITFNQQPVTMKKLFITTLILSGFFMLKAFAGEPVHRTQRAVKLESVKLHEQDSLQEYTGKYKFPEGSVVTDISVTLENGVLTGSSAMGSSELKKMEPDVFQIVAYGGMATFKRNGDGKVSSVYIEIGDLKLEGAKSEGLNIQSERKQPGRRFLR